ncbi:Sas10/Utp3/C1D family protein [Diaporthe amygdali]|uniref:Sas10/Utp3/C1D family protein n=1 Tax=Phomopsis amygdali TaxID=1214568 RepID=UPI0022FE4BE9|nr:Sas10/Utp3/C1D family protein [Diaporthe amygdali]KAJ0118887.1 Sas10/Utp3/C1D family protein [Diaporthe amygdali]
MAAATSLPVLLDSLTQSLSSVFEATSKISSVEAPKDGISLLDVKNELLLSYLQNLVFLILVKLRKSKQNDSNDDNSRVDDGEVVKKLVELRLYLEKGVRPLEEKLRYQIEKVLRAADDAERNEKAAQAAAASGSESESSDDDSDEDSDEEAQSGEDSVPTPNITGLQARPNLGAIARRAATETGGKTSKERDGVYRPPRVAPTVMPTTERREKRERGPMKSATMDEFVADELSTAPVAQPSIGTNIAQFGRRLKTASERKEEDERRDYEERNFTRLPKESKKERAQKAARDGRSGRMDYGGEEWRDLGMGVDRINRITNKKEGGRSTKALLEKSRKRGPDTVDGPRGSGDTGERYQKRLKVLESGRRDRGNRR